MYKMSRLIILIVIYKQKILITFLAKITIFLKYKLVHINLDLMNLKENFLLRNLNKNNRKIILTRIKHKLRKILNKKINNKQRKRNFKSLVKSVANQQPGANIRLIKMNIRIIKMNNIGRKKNRKIIRISYSSISLN